MRMVVCPSLALMLVFLLVIPGVTSSEPLTPDSFEVPRKIEIESEPRPFWVSKEAATGPDGEVDWESLGPGVREKFARFALVPVESYTLSPDHPGGPRKYNPTESGPRPGGFYSGIVFGFGLRNLPSDTLAEQIGNAVSLIDGVVVAKQDGFTRGLPIALLSVRINHFDSSVGAELDSPIANIFWPVTKFSIGSLTFEKGNPEYPVQAPEAGDRILFLSAQFHELPKKRALWADPRRMAYGREGSHAYVPAEWGRGLPGEGTYEDIVAVFDEVRSRRSFLPIVVYDKPGRREDP